MRMKRSAGPYQIPQSRYFNWHTGIRATDLYHAVAQHTAEWIAKETGRRMRGVGEGQTFETLREKLNERDREKLAAHLTRFDKLQEGMLRGGHSGNGAVARWGFRLAEETRELTAGMLHCNPRNVFFANSATCAAAPILIAITRMNKEAIDAVRSGERNSMSPLFFYFSDGQYPTIAKFLFLPERDRLKIFCMMTRQNYGYRSVPFRDIHRALIGTTSNVYVRPEPFSELGTGMFGPGIDIDTDSKANLVAKPSLSNCICVMLEHMDRILGKVVTEKMIDAIRDTTMKTIGKKPLIFLDGSHTFGVVECDVAELCDAYVACSSKGLGAEPTIGIGYAKDTIMEVMENELCDKDPERTSAAHPKIAFQFSPETELGMPIDEAERTRYWTSLPELASANAALHDRMEEKIVRIGYKTRFAIDTIIRRISSAAERRISYYTGSSMLHTISSPLQSFGAHGFVDPEVSGELEREFGREFLADMPNHATMVLRDDICERSKKLDAKKVVKKVGEKGFSISSIPTQVAANFLSGINLERLLRISVRHDVEQDIEGIIRAIWDSINQIQMGKRRYGEYRAWEDKHHIRR